MKLSARMIGPSRKIAAVGFLFAAAAALVILANTASINPHGGPRAAPDALGPFMGEAPIATLDGWRKRKPLIRALFEKEVYGRMPASPGARIVSREVVDDDAFGGRGRVIAYGVILSGAFDGETFGAAVHLDLVLPKRGNGPFPVLLIGAYCPVTGMEPKPAATHGGPGGSCTHGLQAKVLRTLFHFTPATPPMEELLDAGIAVAAFDPAEFVPDDPKNGVAVLNNLAGPEAGADDRWGAIAAWSFVWSRMIDVLEKEPVVDACRIVALGHSRYGKAALLAAAYDARIAGVVSRASGAGGAALSRGKKGETVRDVTRSYPHWFAPAFSRYGGHVEKLDVDQHLLLALIAPRKIYLGNGRQDIWSDPNGVWRAAVGASPVWRLYGKKGLNQKGLLDFPMDADIVYRLRNGPHWALDRDWDDILQFIMKTDFCAIDEK